MLRTVISETLVEHGYHVLEASNPAEALEISRNFDHKIDLCGPTW